MPQKKKPDPKAEFYARREAERKKAADAARALGKTAGDARKKAADSIPRAPKNASLAEKEAVAKKRMAAMKEAETKAKKRKG